MNVYTKQIGQSYLETTDDGYVFYDDGETVYLIGYSGKQTELTLPDKFIGNNYQIYKYAFYNNSLLTRIEIPNGVTSIGSYAFYGCTSLTSIEIAYSVTSIGQSAFENCTGLESVYITDMTAWCNISFYGSESNPLTYAEKLYFKGELVTELVIPEDVTTIGNYTFNGYTSLLSVAIGNGVTSIGDLAFCGCTSLSSVTIGNGVTSIGDLAFCGCTSLLSITIPDNVTSIGSYTFYECTALISVTFENTSGWQVISVWSAPSGTDILSEDLADPATAATYLKSNYCDYSWKRN